jgi:polyphosphate kinase
MPTRTKRRDAAIRVASELPKLPDSVSANLFLNRELSWLDFNARVLEEARDPSVPLAERLKFLGIVGSNLDEFFMVRVAGLKQQLSGHVLQTPPDGMTAAAQLGAIAARTHKIVDEQYAAWRTDVAPVLLGRGVSLVRPRELGPAEQQALLRYFTEGVWPVLTPLAVDPGHPFPILRNRSINLAIWLQSEVEQVARPKTIAAVVQVPSVLPRLVPLSEPGQPFRFALLEDVIAMHVGDLFPGFRVVGCGAFRVTRNFDLSIDEDEADDLLQTIQKELRRRERGNAVRLEVTEDAPPELIAFLRVALKLEPDDVYLVDGPLQLADLTPLREREELAALRDEPFSPQPAPPLGDTDDMFKVIAERDVLLHHPYDSYEDVVEFISEAADDPHVLAIKQTLYRTSADSPIVRALIRAAEKGKQVTAVVELKARFDEAPNIAWARVLEESGVNVVYGLMGLKTHCKVALVVRREGGEIARYAHLSTGNYNPSTARLYSDLSYFTARGPIADDVGALFNLLTGYSSPPSWQRFAVAPVGLHGRILKLIAHEASLGARGRILAKMNSLVDPDVIAALYRASQAGASIDLIVRGICCLRPGVPGVSDNIRVTSVVDRFLEHARIFCFGADAKRDVYLSSADWMPRNFVRRVEIMFPVEDPALKSRIVDEILATELADNVKARRLLPDGRYERVQAEAGKGPQPPVRSQARFMEHARARAQGGASAGPRAPNPGLEVRPAKVLGRSPLGGEGARFPEGKPAAVSPLAAAAGDSGGGVAGGQPAQPRVVAFGGAGPLPSPLILAPEPVETAPDLTEGHRPS